MANENGVSRSALAGTGILSAAVAVIITLVGNQVLIAPTDRENIAGSVRANRNAIVTIGDELLNVAGKQDDVRERLNKAEANIAVAGVDRYRGAEAKLQNEHIIYRLDVLTKQVLRLEGVCYLSTK